MASGSTSTAEPSTAERTAEKRPSDAEAVAFARAVNLQADDIPIPGFEAKGLEKESTSHQLSDCLGNEYDEIIDRVSPHFTGTGSQLFELIASEVGVLATSAEALEEVEELKSEAGKRCLGESIDQFAGSGVHYGKTSVNELSGDDKQGDVALRIETAVIPEEGEPIPIYFDLRGFASGKAAIAVTYVQTGESPDEETEEEMLTLLRGRAERYSLGGGSENPPGRGGHEVPTGIRSKPSEWIERWCEVEIGQSREEAVATMGAYPTEEDSGKIPLIPPIRFGPNGENRNERPPKPLGSDTWEATGTYQFNAFFDRSLHIQQLDFNGPASAIDCPEIRIR